MAKNYYKMREEAFSNLPKLNVFYDSRAHTRAWQYLVSCLSTEEQFLLVSGDYGMGKTMLSIMLIRLLKKRKRDLCAHIATSGSTYKNILYEIASSLGVPVAEGQDATLEFRVQHALRDLGGKRAIYVVIDDAQELDVTTLERLRGLANVNCDGFFPVRTVFFAHSAFVEKLKTACLAPLDQRIKRRCHLDCLGAHEATEYIYYRLYKSGAPGVPAFSDEALQKIYLFSNGVPRLINNVCDICLLIGEARQLQTLDAAVVTEAVHTLGKTAEFETEVPDVQALQAMERAEAITVRPVEAPGEKGPEVSGSMVPLSQQQDTAKGGGHGGFRFGGLRPVYRGALLVLMLLVAAGLAGDFLWAPPHAGRTAVTKQAGVSGPFPVQGPGEQQVSVESHAKQPVMERPAAASGNAPAGIRHETAQMHDAAQASRTCYPYSLRLACFRRQADAEKQISMYHRAGLSPYLVKVDLGVGGVWWRIYMGQYRSRQDAEQARASLGLDGAIVAKTAYANLVPVLPADVDREDMLERLRHLGYWPYRLQAEEETPGVVVGAFITKRGADDQNAALLAQGVYSRVIAR